MLEPKFAAHSQIEVARVLRGPNREHGLGLAPRCRGSLEVLTDHRRLEYLPLRPVLRLQQVEAGVGAFSRGECVRAGQPQAEGGLPGGDRERCEIQREVRRLIPPARGFSGVVMQFAPLRSTRPRATGSSSADSS